MRDGEVKALGTHSEIQNKGIDMDLIVQTSAAEEESRRQRMQSEASLRDEVESELEEPNEEIQLMMTSERSLAQLPNVIRASLKLSFLIKMNDTNTY